MRRRLFRLLLVTAMGLSIGCAPSPQERRLGFHRGAFESYSEQMKTYILKGEVIRGMSREQVYLARGVPANIERGGESPEVGERWVYPASRNGKLVVEFERGRAVDVRGDRPPPPE